MNNSSHLSLIKEICFSRVGQELLESIVTKIPMEIGLDYMFIAHGDLDKKLVRTLAFSKKGNLEPNFVYHLENSPCEVTYEKEACLFKDHVQEKFPKDQDLIDLSVEGYIGHVLKSREGEKIGLIVGMSQKPIEFGDQIAELFTIISSRAAIELEQLKMLNLLKQSFQEVKNIQKVFNEHNLVSSTDIKGNITYVNDKFCEVSGYTAEELLGQNHRIIKSDEHSPEFYKKLWKTVANGKVWKGTVKNLKKDGGYYWVEATIAPMFDHHGHITHYVSARTDITHQKDMEQHANDLRKEAEKLAKTKTMFLANMSHEIRTPLNGIQGSIDILLDTELDKEQKELALMVHHSTKSLNVIVNDILDFSKLEAQKVKIDNIVLDYNYIVDDVISLFKDQALKNGIQLVKEFPEEYPKTLMGDPTRLRQILTNVVSNAVKFTHSGEVKIKVEFKPCRYNKFCVDTTVQDTGIGMSEEQLEKLFEVFDQADNTTTRLYGGTGLGASICKKLIELLDGKLEVKSKLNEGTTFNYQIPFEFSEKKFLNEKTRHKPERQYGKTAILAEDNPINLKVAKKTLANLGIETLVAVNGKEAVDLAQQKEHDFILMDIQMPVMSGLEACKFLKESGYEKPIVALTANVLEDDINSYVNAGMKECIAKPFKLHQLVEILDRVILN